MQRFKSPRLFDIITLSSKHSRLNDPVTIITSGIAVLSQLFPNIFGGGRKQLTNDDWLQLIPGAGYWSTRLREYLKTRIRYDVDFSRNVLPFSQQFAFDNRATICGTKNNEQCYAAFLELLRTESQTGGQSPIGITPGGIGQTINYSTLVPIAIGGVLLVLLMNSKKKK